MKNIDMKYTVTLFIAFACIVVMLSEKCYSQDIHFSQFMESPVILNPSMAGTMPGKNRAVMNYRNQWKVIDPYETFSASYDMHLKNLFNTQDSYPGIGIVIFRDQAGASKLARTQAELSIAYHIALNSNSILSAGVVAGMAQRSIDQDELTWDNQYNGGYDPALPGEYAILPSKAYLDVGCGVSYSYYTKDKYMTANNGININSGFAILHAAGTKTSFYEDYIVNDREGMKFIGHLNTSFGIENTNLGIRPAALYVRQNTVHEIVGGLMLRYLLVEGSKHTGFVDGAAISVGGFYRYGDAVIPRFQIEYGSFSVGVSYDINVSSLRKISYGRGGLEIFVRWNNPNPFSQRGSSLI